jgi:phosphoglycolate phosphatase
MARCLTTHGCALKSSMRYCGSATNSLSRTNDTIHDYEVAREIGVDCVLFVGGHNTKERLGSCGVPVFDSLAQLRFE